METKKDLTAIINKLAKIKLFEKVKDEPEKLRKIAELLQILRCPAGSLIIKEGDFGDELYILNSGIVEITKSTLQDEEYTIVKLTGEMNVFFGELALLDNDRRSATIRAVSDCEYWALSRNNFEKLGEDEPALGLLLTREIAKILAQRLRKANQDMIVLFEALVNEIEEKIN